jgi:hypothetical protein
MIYGWALAKATKRAPDKPRTLAFVAGGLVPDLPTYVFFFVHTVFLGTSQQTMWDTLYFNSAWSPILTLSHSLLLWPLLLLFAVYTKRTLLTFFTTSALLHILLDFFVHHNDAYRHFWPLTDWKFISPISYWDPRYYGNWVGLLDTVLIIILLLWLLRMYTATKARIGITLIIVLYSISTILPYFIFNHHA